jgi:hypothetical protein
MQRAVAAGELVIDSTGHTLSIALIEPALAGRGAVPSPVQVRVGPYVGVLALGTDEAKGVSGTRRLLQATTASFYAVNALILSRIRGILTSRAVLAAERRV